jgi:hypothetical protein
MERHIDQPRAVLANIEDFGRIYRCSDCDNIHLQVGPVNVSLSVEAYMQLVALVNTSASNFYSSFAWPGANDHERRGSSAA